MDTKGGGGKDPINAVKTEGRITMIKQKSLYPISKTDDRVCKRSYLTPTVFSMDQAVLGNRVLLVVLSASLACLDQSNSHKCPCYLQTTTLMPGEGSSYPLAMRKDERRGKRSLRAELEYKLELRQR